MVKLQVYNTSLDLCVELYRFVQSQQLRTDYALSTQLRRAAISIPANISEGYLRSKKMFSNHLSIAIGSSNEVQTLLTLSSRIYQLDPSQLILDYEVLSKQLMTLRNRLH